MAITKLIASANYNLRRENYQRLRVSSGIKNIEGRIRNRDIEIKQIIPQCRNIEVKKKWTSCHKIDCEKQNNISAK